MLEKSAERPANNNLKKMSGLSYLMPFHFLDFLKIIIYFAHVLSGYFQFPKLCGCVVGVVVFLLFKKSLSLN